MYESIEGTLREKSPQRAIVEAGGIGYRLLVPVSAFAHLPDLSQRVFLFLSHIVREDSQTLYAFLKKEERDLFEMLISVSGIGPKTALSIVGHIEVELFEKAVETKDTRLLSKLPGLGKKTAEKLILEMQDKLKTLPRSTSLTGHPHPLFADGMSALLHLGYPPAQAQRALKEALAETKEPLDLGGLIRIALQNL